MRSEAIRSTNKELAYFNLKQLQSLNVKTICVCPGARNSPWIELLESQNTFEVLRFFDERSAGFFALSRAKETLAPVAVATTSGTAVGELLPAMMEAYYSGSKLIALTADRPRRFRGTGAPQACEQKDIFGIYARTSSDLDGESDFTELEAVEFPFHLNVCFEEPLPSHDSNRFIKKETEDKNFKMGEFPLLIVGELSFLEAQELTPALVLAGLPVITEALSQLRENPALETIRIRPHRNLWKEAHDSGYPIDSVIRIGGVPTLRFWRDLEVHPEASLIPVASLSTLPFRGLPRASLISQNASRWLEKNLESRHHTSRWNKSFENFKMKQDNRFKHLEVCLKNYPLSEPAWMRSLSLEIKAGSSVYLGNSLPIREWDMAATQASKHFLVRANRGLNGIDGQISSFFGGLRPDCENWAILGDLTALYDSSAPWILNQLHSQPHFKLVIINNSGGRIFDRIFSSSFYANNHSLGFGDWAKQWGLSHATASDPRLLSALSSSVKVVEVIPDAEQTESFWAEWERE